MLLLAVTSAPTALKWGAFAFGTLIGWNAYFINRYRQTIVIGDLAAIIGAVGGGAVLTLFPAQSETFGYYGIGLAVGFFLYLLFMLVLVLISKQATVNWLLGIDQAGEPPLQHPDAIPAGQQQQQADHQEQPPPGQDVIRPFSLSLRGRPVSFVFKRPFPPA